VSTPRLEVDLGKVQHNARTLVDRLAPLGVGVTAVTKATLGSVEVATAVLAGGAHRLGESRIENVERLRAAGVVAPILLVRSPMLSQVDRVVTSADASCNTEVEIVAALSEAALAQGRRHGVVLMVELGDLREGILAEDLERVVKEVLRLPAIHLRGIGANLACQNGVVPDDRNMARLSALAGSVEVAFGLHLVEVSGGSSANLDWALGGGAIGRVDDLRLGESILLGREPLHRTPIEGLHTDAFTLVGEVIEAKVKPSQPWGSFAQTAFGPAVDTAGSRSAEHGEGPRAIVALGHQDTDPWGLTPPPGIEVLGASSDHLVLATGAALLALGSEVRFQLTYGALVRATTSSAVPVWHGGGTR